jgi:hypothetical protein
MRPVPAAITSLRLGFGNQVQSQAGLRLSNWLTCWAELLVDIHPLAVATPACTHSSMSRYRAVSLPEVTSKIMALNCSLLFLAMTCKPDRQHTATE